jgi:hypothetical protein
MKFVLFRMPDVEQLDFGDADHQTGNADQVDDAVRNLGQILSGVLAN